MVGPDDISLFFKHLLDAFEIFQVLVGFFTQELANFFEIELRRIAHAPLSPPEKTLHARRFSQDPHPPHPCPSVASPETGTDSGAVRAAASGSSCRSIVAAVLGSWNRDFPACCRDRRRPHPTCWVGS